MELKSREASRGRVICKQPVWYKAFVSRSSVVQSALLLLQHSLSDNYDHFALLRNVDPVQRIAEVRPEQLSTS